MSRESPQPKLTSHQIIHIYERRLSFAVLWNIVGSVAGLGLAFLFWSLLETLWLRVVLVALSLLAAGMAQRLVVLWVKCPACGWRPLARIHSILQSRNVRTCPGCKVKLRD